MTYKPDTSSLPQGWQTMSPAMQEAQNYYRWIVSVLSPYLGENILDIGSGYGAHLVNLLPLGKLVTSIEISTESVAFLDQRFAEYDNYQAMQGEFGNHLVMDMLDRKGFDTISCLNVLEHIEDDLNALRQMHTLLSPQSGVLLLQVPAHAWLYGSLDSQAGHFLRYQKAPLRQKLVQAGFEVLKVDYFNSISALAWFVNARILKQELHAGGVNSQIRLYDRYLLPIFRVIESIIPLPFGQSLIAVARATSDNIDFP
jgi:2-polyprenyl-3-methyl-5-hydroxy-6-metoxy-1,4-benzoquinol methylase